MYLTINILLFSLYFRTSFPFYFFILILIPLVQSRFRYAIKSRCFQLFSQVFPFFSQNSRTSLSIMKFEISGKLIHIRKSIFNWRKVYAGFSVAQNCTTLFFCCPLSLLIRSHPKPPSSATAEMRCEIFNLVYPIATPSSKPLPLLNSSHPTLALPPSLPVSLAR